MGKERSGQEKRSHIIQKWKNKGSEDVVMSAEEILPTQRWGRTQKRLSVSSANRDELFRWFALSSSASSTAP